MPATASPHQIAAFGLRPGDVIITKDSEIADDIGVSAYVRASAPDLMCGYHLAMLRADPAKLDGRYLYWYMCSTAAREHLPLPLPESRALVYAQIARRSSCPGLAPHPSANDRRLPRHRKRAY